MFSLERIFSPEIYQGRYKHTHYFEGWYYKQVSADRQHSVAFIPGVSKNPNDPHSFIQVIYTYQISTSTHTLDNKNIQLETYYLRFPLSDFTYKDQPFNIQVGKNRFSKKEIILNVDQDGLFLRGKIALQELEPIERSLFCPNIMGFFGYLSFMECYHGIVSMGHTCHGTINFQDKLIDFSNGRGYIEKDWGHSFPKTYNWVQCNHFSNPRTSLFFSVAHIPFLGTSFKGFICNVNIEGCEYRWATYNGATILQESVSDHRLHYILSKGNLRLHIEADIMDQGILVAPKNGLMSHNIKEGLMGDVRIKLIDKQGVILYEDNGTNAGVEIVT